MARPKQGLHEAAGGVQNVQAATSEGHLTSSAKQVSVQG